MNSITAIKALSTLVVGTGVSAVVGNAVKATSPVDMKTTTKVCVVVGTFVLSNMVGGIASKYTNETIDKTAEEVKDARDKIKNAKKNKDKD